MKTFNLPKTGFALAVLAIFGYSVAQTQHSQHQGHVQAPPKQQKSMGMGMGMGMHMGMMNMGKCMSDMKAGARKLDDLQAMMNACKGQDKIDATAAVVNEMLAQKKACDQMCMQMMEHMSMMEKMAAPKASDHSAHHGG